MAQTFQVSTPQGQGFDVAAEQEEIARRRRLADMLRQQSAQPEGQMVSGRFVAPSITQRLAGLLNSYQSGQIDRQAGQQSRDLAERAQARRIGETSQIVAALTGGQRGVEGMPDETGNPTVQMQPVAPDQNRALQLAAGSMTPEARAFVPQILGMQQQEKMAAEARGARQEAMAADQAFRRERAEADRAQQMEVLRMRMEDQRASQAERLAAQRELQQMQIAARQDMARLAASLRPAPQGSQPPKPLSASELKMQQENVEAIGAAAEINTNLQRFNQMLQDGKLTLSPIGNLIARGRNAAGVSNERSANLAEFQSTLEKLRNDSLRLNSGVQTEGDAQRAWNELIANINDQRVVQQQMRRIMEINDRAVNLRQMMVDQIRENRGLPGIDVMGEIRSRGAAANVGQREVRPGGTPTAPSILPPVGGLSAQEQAELQELRRRLGR